MRILEVAEPRSLRALLLVALMASLSLDARAQFNLSHGDMNFTVPTAGALYLSAITAKTGADWKFGVGTTSANCNVALASLPNTNPPTGEVAIGAYNAGDQVIFCMWSQYDGNTAWAFSDGNDAASVVAFWDTQNKLGMGGQVIQQTSPMTWTMHLDNAVSYLYDDSNDDILIQIRLGSGGPAPPTGGIFVAPSGGTLYLKCVGGSAGATSQFGIGTSPSTFVSYLSSLPQSCPDTEVAAGTVAAGQTVPFGIQTSWGGQTYWAFSTSSDQGSMVSFTDMNNSLGMGGNIIQQTGTNTWVMHLNDAAHYTLSSAEANNILVQIRVSSADGTPAQTGGVFVAPSAGTLYLKCVGGSAGATSQFGTGNSSTNFVSYLSSLPQSCPDTEVAAGTVTAGQTVPFGIETSWGGQTYWAFSTGTDQGSMVSFTDMNNSLGLGGSIIQQTGSNTWVLHLNDAAHYTLSTAEANNILIQLRLQAPVGPPPTYITGIGNAASYQPGLSPGMLATLFGTNLSPVVGVASPGSATSYEGVSVTVGGRLAPLFTVANLDGSEQINFQVPAELATPNTVAVQVNNNGSIGTMNVPLTLVQPGIFGYVPAGSSLSYAAILKPDGSVVSPSNPVSRGSTVAMFLTGLGPTSPFVATGQPGPIPLATTVYQPVVLGLNNDGVPAIFSGLAPYFVGLYQLNFTIPANAVTGSSVRFSVSINGVSSQVSTIAIQ
jgi:uncharacterized protein (TIGR03437 family)